LGLETLCSGRQAFLNCTREVLLKDYVTLLSPQQVVVEILENVEPDDLVIAACQPLKEAGYQIALDDFAPDDRRHTLADFADVIKVDIRSTTLKECERMVKRYGPWQSRMLAEKVETQAEFAACKAAGFVYFQGYFFRRPEVLATHEIPANRLNYVRMLQAVSRPELDPREIEDVIKTEASICYRLLRYLNSAVFSFSTEIHSIRHALSLLGEREIRRWVRLVATLGAGQNKSSELVTLALVRARFCELLSPKIQHGIPIFSFWDCCRVDAMLEIPMTTLLQNIALD
jgi:EAL and modified HD-GYP domain-containing signal transduction protein